MTTRAFGTIVAVLLALCPTHASSDEPDTSWVRWRMFLGAKIADGNGATDESTGIAVDATGNVYVVGLTDPQGHEWKLNPDLAPLVPLPDGRDAFVVKLSTTGKIIWYTFLGGGSIERAHGVAVDGNGNVYVAGYGEGYWNVPMGPVNLPAQGAENGFVAKLSAAGDLLWHTFHGTSGKGVAVEEAGHVYMAGLEGDASLFVKLRSSDGVHVRKSSNPNHKGAKGIAVDHAAEPTVYIVGDDGSNAFAATLSPADDYQWNVDVNTGLDVANAVAVGVDGSVYVAGAKDAPTGGNRNAHVVKLGSSNADTSFGDSNGENDELAISIAVGESGDLYVVGNSWSDSGAPYPGWGDPKVPFQGKQDAWLARLSGDDMVVSWSTFLGGEEGEWASGVAVDGSGNIYVSGLGNSSWKEFWPAALPSYWQATDAYIVAARAIDSCASTGDGEEPPCVVKRSQAWAEYVACVELGANKYYAEPGLHGDPYTEWLRPCRKAYILAWGPPCTGPRFSNNADGTVTDHLSGLVWEKKRNLDEQEDPSDPHDADRAYTWSDGTPWFETGTAFDSFLRTLNDGKGFACSNGWRLPTFAELHTLMDESGTGMLPDFPDAENNAAGQYWSSTSSPLIFGNCKELRSCAWSVIFTPPPPPYKPQQGSVTVNGKGGGHVRAVRGGL